MAKEDAKKARDWSDPVRQLARVINKIRVEDLKLPPIKIEEVIIILFQLMVRKRPTKYLVRLKPREVERVRKLMRRYVPGASATLANS
jgi:hypothetical protein